MTTNEQPLENSQHDAKLPVMCRVYKHTYSGYKGWFDGMVNRINEDGSLNVTYKMGMNYTDDFQPERVVIHGT